MLLLLRKIKHSLFESGQFRKYFTYAIGEIILVIIGILIALQIDNWNSDKQREEILNNYLAIIADNIKADLKELSNIRTERESAYDLASRWRYFGSRDGSYTVDEIKFASRTLISAREQQYFDLTNSGFDTLKSSGYLERLRGKEIEGLLYDYYDTANRILREEQNHNDYISELWLQILARWPVELDRWSVADPALQTSQLFEAQQPFYEELFDHPTTGALYRQAESTGALMLEYERLEILGNALLAIMLDNENSNENTSGLNRLDELHDPDSPYGYPKVITDGQIAFHSFFPGVDDSVSYDSRTDGARTVSNNVFVTSYQKHEDTLQIIYGGGAEWAGWWYLVGSNLTNPELKDFSRFNTLVVELKGAKGGETVLLNMEDGEDLRDGSSTRVPLALTDEWQTFEISLEQFKTADLSIIRSLGFIVTVPEPQTFSVRTLHFITK